MEIKLKEKSILSERENEVLEYLITGYTNREIANKLYISISTVKTYVEKIYAEFNVHNRIELIYYTIKNKIVSLE